MKEDIDRKLETVDMGNNPEQYEAFNFYQAAGICMEGAMNYCKRYGAYAEELAGQETDAAR